MIIKVGAKEFSYERYVSASVEEIFGVAPVDSEIIDELQAQRQVAFEKFEKAKKKWKPSGKLIDMAVEKMGVCKDNVISIGDSIIDKQMSDNGGVRFYGAIWDSQEVGELITGKFLSTPTEILRKLNV